MTLHEVALILAMALAVYLPKAVPLLLVSSHLPSGARRWLQYAAPAILSALVAPDLLPVRDGSLVLAWDQAGYLAAFVMVLATRRVVPPLLVGLAIVAVATALGG